MNYRPLRKTQAIQNSFEKHM